MELQKKLAKIQKELKAPKNQFNKFGGYKYRSCEDILEAVKPLLDGAVLIISDEIDCIGERYYIRATAILSDGEEKIEVQAYAREPDVRKGMDAAQVTGASSSYARKYALNGLFCIEDTKDPDSTHKENGEKPQEAPPKKQAPSKGKKLPLSDAQNKKFYAMCKQKEWSDEEISEFREWLKSRDEIEILEGTTPTGKIRTTFTMSGISYVFDNFHDLCATWIEEVMAD